jgi:hypothetical protein
MEPEYRADGEVREMQRARRTPMFHCWLEGHGGKVRRNAGGLRLLSGPRNGDHSPAAERNGILPATSISWEVDFLLEPPDKCQGRTTP